MIPLADQEETMLMQDVQDAQHLYNILERKIIPMYYKHTHTWVRMMKQSMKDVLPVFDSNRMADEYYRRLYDA